MFDCHRPIAALLAALVTVVLAVIVDNLLSAGAIF
jgi:hypothetical protein